MAAVSLFWDTNMAAVTSCENTLYVAQGKLRVTRRSQSVTRKLPEVSRCIPPKQWQRNVQKSALHVESCFFAN